MGKNDPEVLYAHATVELTDLEIGDPPVAPRPDENGRAVLRLFRRGDVIPVELFADYIPSPGMPHANADLDSLLEYGAVGWEPPDEEDIAGPFYVLRLPDGQEIRVAGVAPDPDAIQVLAGESIGQSAGTAVEEGS